MESWFLNNSLALGLSLILTGIIIPQILAIAFKKNLFDSHDERKIHKGAVPRLGGIAFVPSILFSVMFVLGLGLIFENLMVKEAMEGYMVQLLFLICSLMLLFLVGIADDLIGVRYISKLMFQIICAAITVISGTAVFNLYGFLGLGLLPNWFSWLTTGFLVVYIVNALNLIDGIDGLCSGLAAIALFFYGAVFYFAGYHLYSLLAWATFGTLVPFFYFNMFGDPNRRKKIFMGDTGSLTIGMMIVFLAIEMTNIKTDVRFIGDVNPIILAFAPLILPMFDVIRVFNHRVQKHRSPFLPDRSHIHHKLLAMGVSQRKALGLILLGAVVFLVVNYLLSPYMNVNILVACDVVVWIVANLILTKSIRSREARTGKILYD